MFSFKNEKIAGDITILCMYTKSHNIWGAVPEIQSKTIFVILGNFFPFTPLTTHKIKILKKWRKHLEKSSFYTCVPKIKVVWCMLPEIWSVTGTIFYQFRPLFCPFTLTILKIKIWKKHKKHLRIFFLHKSTINEDHMMYGSWDI